jgi:hypothetical protein
MNKDEERMLLEVITRLTKISQFNSDMLLILSDYLLETEKALLELIKLQEITIRNQIKKS